jgi:hypothetical protein
MLKLTLKQKLRLWLWQHHRSLIIVLFSLLACLLALGYNRLVSADTVLTLLLTLVQLGIGALLALVVIVLSD